MLVIRTGAEPVEVLSREEFFNDYWHYNAGEHVTFIGPTGSGKTTLAYQLLDVTATENLPAVILVMKPKDTTVVEWTKKLGFKKTESWPPVLRRGIDLKKRRGFVFWPKQNLKGIHQNTQMLQREFSGALEDCYSRGNFIIFADEVAGLENELKLSKELVAIWMRGRSLGCGLWAASQRPRDISLHAYAQAEHLFLFYDPDLNDRKRFAEIGGVNPLTVEQSVVDLRPHEFLYIGRSKGPDGRPGLARVKA